MRHATFPSVTLGLETCEGRCYMDLVDLQAWYDVAVFWWFVVSRLSSGGIISLSSWFPV